MQTKADQRVVEWEQTCDWTVSAVLKQNHPSSMLEGFPRVPSSPPLSPPQAGWGAGVPGWDADAWFGRFSVMKTGCCRMWWFLCRGCEEQTDWFLPSSTPGCSAEAFTDTFIALRWWSEALHQVSG